MIDISPFAPGDLIEATINGKRHTDTVVLVAVDVVYTKGWRVIGHGGRQTRCGVPVVWRRVMP